MFLESICVSVDYSDYLRHTLPYNRQHFDRVVVVTSPTDEATQQLCQDNDAICVITSCIHDEGAAFNKGKAINEGVAQLRRTDWVLITDADMIMPKTLRTRLEEAQLDKEMIYGTTRSMCPSYEDWLGFQETGQVGSHWQHQGGRLCVGVGFFQLVNSLSPILMENERWYSEKYGHAGRSDRIFLRQWPPAKRGRLKNITPIHLASSPSLTMGVNWHGRVTPRFGIV